MAEFIDAIASWPSLFIALVLFGFAPGLLLRLIVLIYPKDDPRRAELIAEVYAVPRLERLLWVTEQFEVALSEGMVHRWRARKRQRIHKRPRQRLALPWRGLGIAIAMVLASLASTLLSLDPRIGVALLTSASWVVSAALLLQLVQTVMTLWRHRSKQPPAGERLDRSDKV